MSYPGSFLWEQQTAPLPLVTQTFRAYLIEHRLTWLEVARASGVPCLVVWSIDHGLCVQRLHADLVRQGLYQLTGRPFVGPIQSI